MWSTSNGEQKGAYSLIPFNRLSGNFVDRMGTLCFKMRAKGHPSLYYIISVETPPYEMGGVSFQRRNHPVHLLFFWCSCLAPLGLGVER